MSTTDTSALFRPFSLKTLDLKNRIVMAPMTRGMAPGGIRPVLLRRRRSRRMEGRHRRSPRR
jgi:2,4-dienoyl-CoA reductase-like NADH-dependent reductase (Old Yellow Enzyme family)